jgi:uncharacterized membrane protein (DUF485 family)
MQKSRANSPKPSLPPASRRGLALFSVYVALYGGFMGLVLGRPDLLAMRPFGGVNLAVLSGLGLIAAAVVLAMASMLGRRPSEGTRS